MINSYYNPNVSHLKNGQDVELVRDAVSDLLNIGAHELHVSLPHLVDWLLQREGFCVREFIMIFHRNCFYQQSIRGG